MITIQSVFGAGCILAIVAMSACAGAPVADQLIFGDIVVQAQVSAIEYELVEADEWYLGDAPSSEPVRLARLDVEVIDVVRGPSPDGNRMSFYIRAAEGRWTEALLEKLEEGREVVLCGRYREGFRGGAYGLGEGDFFLKDGSDWLEFRDRQWGRPRMLKQLVERAREGTVARMAAQSDVIVTGTVVSTREIEGDGGPAEEAIVEVSSSAKGSAPNQIKVTGKKGFGEGDWREMIEPLRPGSTYVMFLRKHDGFYTPAAGLRSMFRESGGRMVQRNNTPTGHTKLSLQTEVRRLVSQD